MKSCCCLCHVDNDVPCAGKNGEYSLTRDVDEALTRALVDMSKPFVVDAKDDGLTQCPAQSRLPDSMVGMNDEELMKHLASVLFCRSTTSPTEELAESIGELGGGLVSSDLRGITQALSASSAWSTVSIDCDGMTAVTADAKLDRSGIETACISNSIADHQTPITTVTPALSVSNDSSVSLSSVPPAPGLTHSTVLPPVTGTRQPVLIPSLPAVTVAVCSCLTVPRTEDASTVLSPVPGAAMSLDRLLAPIVTAPVLHAGALPALPQVFVSSPGSLHASAPGTVSLPSSGLLSLPNVQTLMNPTWRYAMDSRSMVTSGLSALPLASIFTPFSTAFCPPPPVPLSSVVKMDHPLASATILSRAPAAGCSTSTVCSPSFSDTAVSSVESQLTTGQAVLLPSCLSSSSAVSSQTPLTGT